MTIGARAHDFGRHSPAELAKRVKAAGFDGVQLALAKAIQGIERVGAVTPAHLKDIREGFARNRVEISVLGCYVEPALPDKEKRLAQVKNFLLGLQHAKDLGVALVGTETTNFAPVPEQEPLRERAYQDLKDSVLRMVEAAERLGPTVAIEPVADHTLNSAALTRRLLDEVGSDHLKLILDPVNLILADTAHRQEEIYREFLRLVGQEIVAVHVKDIVFEAGEKVWRNIGKGMVDFDAVFPWLRRHKPDVPILREHVKMDSYALDVAAMAALAG